MAERVACMIVGIVLSIIGLILIALGLTFLPIIGIFAAFLVLALAFYFFRPGMWVLVAEREMEPVVSQQIEFWEPLAAQTYRVYRCEDRPVGDGVNACMQPPPGVLLNERPDCRVRKCGIRK